MAGSGARASRVGPLPGVARARWPIRSSKPAGRGSPTVGRFDSCAAPLGGKPHGWAGRPKEQTAESSLAVSAEVRSSPPISRGLSLHCQLGVMHTWRGHPCRAVRPLSTEIQAASRPRRSENTRGLRAQGPSGRWPGKLGSVPFSGSGGNRHPLSSSGLEGWHRTKHPEGQAPGSLPTGYLETNLVHRIHGLVISEAITIR